MLDFDKEIQRVQKEIAAKEQEIKALKNISNPYWKLPSKSGKFLVKKSLNLEKKH